MSSRNLRAARSFRSRAKAHGIRNVPPTPSLSHSAHGEKTFGFEGLGDAAPDASSAGNAEPLRWVKCRATKDEGGGFHYKPGQFLGKGRHPDTFKFRIEGSEAIEVEVNSGDIGPVVEADFTPKSNMVDIVNVHEVSVLIFLLCFSRRAWPKRCHFFCRRPR